MGEALRIIRPPITSFPLHLILIYIMAGIQTTISPYTQRPVTTRQTLTSQELSSVIDKAVAAQKKWQSVSLDDRCALVAKWMDEFERQKEMICDRLSEEMSR